MSFADKLRAWMPLHENRASRAVHFVGAYMFIFALLVPLGLLRFNVGDVPLSAAHVLVAAVALYALSLEWTAGLLMSLPLIPTLNAALSLGHLPSPTVAIVAVGVMVVRFALVVGAHVVLEKKTHGLSLGGPQLFFLEPVYLLTVLLFGMGLKRELHARVMAGGGPRPAPLTT
ncbi:Mpo1-like protein [Myxococcus stipitatus]|uniref:Mpo1-like protein n=1 Tax=Myxococcus stipitatus TaxID=83455 RepID=UPI0030D10E04